MTTLTPAPDAVVQLVRCGCTKSKCSSNNAAVVKPILTARTCVAVLMLMTCENKLEGMNMTTIQRT